MPNRIIKESICTSDNLDRLSWFEEVLFYRLIVNCDDYGRFDGRMAVIKNRLFPLKENVTIKSVEAAIKSLVSAELVTLYVFEGKPYLCLPTWNNHQQIRAKRSKYPSPNISDSQVDINCNQVQANAPVIQSESVSESNPNAGNARAARFTPPTLEEVTAYFREKGGNADQALRFTAHYASNGWKVGRNPMKDWHAAAVGWITRDKDGGAARPAPGAGPPPSGPMQRYTPEQRRQTYAAATVDLDAMD